MDTPLLVRLPISHYCKKVEWAMAHVGQPHRARDVWFRSLVDFRDVNPENTVPVMAVPADSVPDTLQRMGRVDGAGVEPGDPSSDASAGAPDVDEALLCGSDAIMQWLDAQHPDARLYPSPEVAAWEAWADEELGPMVRRECYRTVHARPHRFGRNPALWTLLLVARPLTLNILKHTKARRHEEADAAARAPTLDRIAAQLQATGTGHLFGDRPTAADFATAALLSPLMRMREPAYTDHPSWPDLQAYVRRMRRARRRGRRLAPAERSRLAALPKITTG